jgi:hypothetical protein
MFCNNAIPNPTLRTRVLGSAFNGAGGIADNHEQPISTLEQAA